MSIRNRNSALATAIAVAQSAGNVEGLIVETVEAFYNRGDMFSAYDVTKQVRSLTSEKVLHADVQSQVHGEFEDGMFPSNYTRTLHKFKTGSGQIVESYVYHLVGQDVNLYNPDKVLQPHVAALAAVAGQVSNLSQTGTTATFQVTSAPAKTGCCGGSCHQSNKSLLINATTVYADSSGRLCIPTALVRQAGFRPGDVAYVQQSTHQGLMVITNTPWNHVQLGTTMVDRDSNIRVTPTLLRKNSYSSKAGSNFQVRGDTTHIVVEQ